MARRLKPRQGLVRDGCRPDLDIEALVRGQPFSSVLVERFEMDRVPRTRGTMYRGAATE